MKLRKRGSGYVEIIFTFMIIVAVVMCFTSLWQPFMVKQTLDHSARTLVKAIEVGGEINSDIDDLKTELINSFPNDVKSSVNVVYNAPFISGTQKIQIADSFDVTITAEVPVKIFEPTFSEPVVVKIPIKKTLQGISQVYFK